MQLGLLETNKQRHTLLIPVFINSENAESVVVHHSHVAPRGQLFRLPKLNDKNGTYVEFKCRKIYEENWIRSD